MSDQEAEELQLHDDEGQMVNRKRHCNNDSTTKLEAIKLARKYSIKSAAKKFDVTRSRIQEWMKQEDELKRQVNDTAGGSKRKRLDACGRQVNKNSVLTLMQTLKILLIVVLGRVVV